MAYVVLDIKEFMKFGLLSLLRCGKNFHKQYKFHSQYYCLQIDTLQNILLIELRWNGKDKHTGTKCFILGRRADEVLEASFEYS